MAHCYRHDVHIGSEEKQIESWEVFVRSAFGLDSKPGSSCISHYDISS